MLENTAVQKLYLRQLKFKLFFSERKIQICAQKKKEKEKRIRKTIKPYESGDGHSDLSVFQKYSPRD